jgi:hypothetical protein
MILEPIHAGEFAKARRPLRRSPAACQWPQMLRLAFLVAIALGLVSLSLHPGPVLTAGAEISQHLDPA